MRHIVILIWALIIGQIVAYLGAALSHTLYSFPQAVAGSVVIALMVILIGAVSQPNKKTKQNK